MNGEFVTSYAELAEVQTEFRAFVDKLVPGKPVVILCDGDVDGLGAATVLWHYLNRRGFAADQLPVLQPGKGQNAFTPVTGEQVAAYEPGALFVLDLGIRDYAIVPGVASVLLDHHRPAGVPSGALAITGYQWQPIPTSSLLTFLLVNVDNVVNDKAWAAAIGNLGDLGPEHPVMQAAIREQKQKWVREATSLLNAAKRSSRPEEGCAAAFRVLRDSLTARTIVEGGSSDSALLRQLKGEVQSELANAKRVAPKFSRSEKVALLKFDSPARVHPLLAQSWRGRLKDYIVIAANSSYLAGKVAFSIRTNADVNLLDFLQRYAPALEGEESEYGHGHDKATGGVISFENWQRLTVALGF